MGRDSAYRSEIGKYAVVYLGEGFDTIAGTLARVTIDEVILTVEDEFGAPSGITQAIPWHSIYRIMLMEMDALTDLRESIHDEDDGPEAPEWVAEVLAAAQAALEEDDDDGRTI